MVCLLPIFLCCLVGASSAYPTDGSKTPEQRHLSTLSKIAIMTKMAFNFIDVNGDGMCSEEEISYLADTPLNGLRFKGKSQTTQLFKAMDTDGNGKVSEQEFVSFDRWLPVIVNGKGKNRKIALKTLRSFSAHDGSEFASLDVNRDGYIDEREISLDPLRKTHAL